MYCHYIGWCIGKCPLYRGVLYQRFHCICTVHVSTDLCCGVPAILQTDQHGGVLDMNEITHCYSYFHHCTQLSDPSCGHMHVHLYIHSVQWHMYKYEAK